MKFPPAKMCTLNKTHLNNIWLKEEVSSKGYFRVSKSFLNVANIGIREKFIELNAYIRKDDLVSII